MKLNRRNVLVGLGTIVAGGGAALGTGAFSTVEAERNVSIETAGDSGALLGLEITNDTLRGEDDDTIEFDLESDLNIDATTTFDEALRISNNADPDDDIGTISVEITADGDNLLVDSDGGETATGMNFVGNADTDGDENVVEIGEGEEEAEVFDVVFDLEGITDSEEGDDELPDEIEITAEQAS